MPVTPLDNPASPLSILKEYFGYDSFRLLQAEAIDAVLQKKDALILMPTGGGKSLCYQIPAMVLPGICVVVSPLISLMKDQVESLRQNGIAAAFVNSTQSLSEQRHIERKCMKGGIKLLYVSPEKMCSDSFFNFLQHLKPILFAVDEAHCVSFWGHDFRPEYTQLNRLKNAFPDVPMIALTATADKTTRNDIVKQLELNEPEIFVSSFDRPNLRLVVLPARDRVKKIIAFLQQRPTQSGIIYCLSRKSTESLAEKLRSKGFSAAPYHARLGNDQRARTQEAFIKDNLRIVCATVAFGMGIDKSNVRFVIHYNLPKNIESYYQEIGRAGRDGLDSDTLLFYSFGDVITHRKMLNEEESKVQKVKLAKLERLQQYAESQICRRRILLNYFDEEMNSNCGNCDVCAYPRETFDGTLFAQKAFSAILRTNERASTGMLIDILRGMNTYRVQQFGYDRIKTFGAGKELNPHQWNDCIAQFINLGYLNVAYNEYNALKITDKAKQVLFEGEKVTLARPKVQEAAPGRKGGIAGPDGASPERNELFEHLRKLRKKLADEQGVPPYVVFTDKTLLQMAKERPVSEAELLEISGVGLRKMAFYGEVFLEAIIEFLVENGKARRGSTRLITLYFHNKEMTVEEIAQKRNLKAATIYGHLGQLYEQGQQLNLQYITNPDVLNDILPVIKKHGTEALTPLMEATDNKYDFGILKFAVSYWQAEGEVE